MKKKNATITLKPLAIAEYPDPGLTRKHYFLLCKAKSVPKDIPLDPNPREQNLNRMVSKEISASLIDSQDPRFHLKNKGITMLAKKVTKGRNQDVVIEFVEGQGIIDGGHTYKIIQEAKASKTADPIPEKQFVKIEILTGIEEKHISDIARGLNTSVQVSRQSLMNLEGHFEWIQDTLKNESYGEKIIYRENAEGDIDIRDIIACLYMFVPQRNGAPKSEHPRAAYSRKGACLEEFQENLEDFKEMKPILRDILELHDYILFNAVKKYNDHTGGNGALLSFMQKTKTKKQKQKPLFYMNKEAWYLMEQGALYPILGAFRCLVQKKDGKIGWKVSSFEEVKDFCDSVLGKMMELSWKFSKRHSSFTTMGKDDLLWYSLYEHVEKISSQTSGA